MTGYLTMRGKPSGKKIELSIPNMEIRNIFTEQIMAMFREETGKDGEKLEEFRKALKEGRAEEVERLFNAYLGKTISIRDTFVRKPLKENFPIGKAITGGSKRQNPSACFYHGILLGILGFKGDWYVKSNESNEEAGKGYSDIIIRIEREEIGIIIEVKYAEKGNFDDACREAMEQIETEEYTTELREEGFGTIYKYGIACFKKKCRVVAEREQV